MMTMDRSPTGAGKDQRGDIPSQWITASDPYPSHLEFSSKGQAERKRIFLSQ